MPPNIDSTLPQFEASLVHIQQHSEKHNRGNYAHIRNEKWFKEGLAIVVIGASGDLAKKKTYPSLLDLYTSNLLPQGTIIYGYARSKKTHESLRNDLKPYLLSSNVKCTEKMIDLFLSLCFYQRGKSYGDTEAMGTLAQNLSMHEDTFPSKEVHNRLFYFAVPPNVFGETGIAIKQVAMAPHGWSRVVIEKPFGHDLASCNALLGLLSSEFNEHDLYRIDHYLGKEIVQNLLVFRFGNTWLDWMWHRNAISHVIISFKEDFGTEGRGGYFDQYGIIRDVIQNHLMQVLTLLTMDNPEHLEGDDISERIRDAKVQILKSISPIQLSDCLLGQYDGYKDDDTITNKNTNTPTFAAIRCFIDNPRWKDVPFIMTAGKALDEKKVDVTVHFRKPTSMFASKLPQNELVMRLQPNECIYMKTNIKSPGFESEPIATNLQIQYKSMFNMKANNPDAYTRLILDVLRGRHASFVRDDELRLSWEIFTPLLHDIEKKSIQPQIYKQGQDGPFEFEAFLREKIGISEDQELSSL